MSDLKPTAARLDLLRAVAVGGVYSFTPVAGVSYSRRASDLSRVTAKIREMERAGWVKLGLRDGPSYYARRPWLITDAGRAVLDGAP